MCVGVCVRKCGNCWGVMCVFITMVHNFFHTGDHPGRSRDSFVSQLPPVAVTKSRILTFGSGVNLQVFLLLLLFLIRPTCVII